jgi:ABC-type transport system substrate-binding protein
VDLHAAAHLYVGRGIADYPDPDTFAHGILHSKEGTVGRFCGSPELDALIERARTEIDLSVRHGLYRELEDRVARNALLLPLFHEQVYRFARPEVEGLDITFSTPPVVAYEKLWVRR